MVDKPERPDRHADDTPASNTAGRDSGSDEPRRLDDTGRDDTRPAEDRHPAEDDHTADSGVRDLSALQADDALLDALGGPEPERASTLDDSELNALLLAWRREVDSEPIGELVDVETATATIAAAREAPARRRHRLWVPVASAAAVLAIAFGGVSLAAKDAHPGDTLWGLTQVLYSDHARSVMAAANIRYDFGLARQAISSGDYSGARTALVHAKQAIPTVQRDDGRADLQATRKSLLEQVNNSTPPVTGDNGGNGQGDHSGRVVPPPADSSSASATPSKPPTTTPAPPSNPSTPPTSSSNPPSTPPSNPSPPPSTTVDPNPGTGTGTHSGHVTTGSGGTARTPHTDTGTGTKSGSAGTAGPAGASGSTSADSGTTGSGTGTTTGSG